MKSIFNSSSFKNALAAIAVLVSVGSTTAFASSLRQESFGTSGGFGDSSYSASSVQKNSLLTFENQHMYFNAPASAKQGIVLGRTISATVAVPDNSNVTVPETSSTIALLAMSCFLGLFFKKR